MPRVSKRTKKAETQPQRFHLYSETDLRGFCKETSGNADYESLYR